GTIASRQWNFGDGTATSSQANPSHTYTAGGTFTVTLTVTDNQNATGSVSHPVTVTAPPPPNQPPSVSAGADQTALAGLRLPPDGQADRPRGVAVRGTWARHAHRLADFHAQIPRLGCGPPNEP